MKPQALIIEDEKLVSWSLGKFLEKSGFQVSISEYGKEGIKMAGKNPPDLLFVDYRLPDITGLDVLQELQEIKDETIFFFMTAYGTEEVSIQALKLGAYKYLNKPINFDELTILIGRALDKKETIHSLDLLKKHEQELFKIGEFVSKSDSMRKIIESVHKIVESKTGTILLLGETGTGKDTLARIIHEQSPRKSKPFIIVNCAALSENLLASELFGHEKGAFTDAKSKKLGQVELASGGTVFLDEIGEIPINFQSKLLRFIETQKFYRVGGTREIKVSVRIIAATNRILLDEIEKGNFREDLYYRLNVISLTIPPLRKRKDDIPALIDRFIRMYNNQFNYHVKGISKNALQWILNYHWPGNVRELKNAIERIFLLENPEIIETWHFPGYISRNIVSDDNEKNESLESGEHLEGLFDSRTLADMEKLMIQWALNIEHGNQVRAAKRLDITRDQIRYKMKKHHLLV